jgi:hypothetical protein
MLKKSKVKYLEPNVHAISTMQYFFRNTIHIQIVKHVRILIHMNTHVQYISMSTSERLSQFDIEIHKV